MFPQLLHTHEKKRPDFLKMRCNCLGVGYNRNALKISFSFLKESILFILNLDYAEEDE